MESMPEYCPRCLEHEHDGPCERWWSEDKQGFVTEKDFDEWI